MKAAWRPSLPLSVLLCVLLLGGVSCRRDAREAVIGSGVVATPAVNLRDRLGAAQVTVATLRLGDRVDIVERKRRWVRVRTGTGQEGWLEQTHLIGEDVLKRFELLRVQAGAHPSQGQAHARRDLNLHLEPDRKAVVYYQLKENESCEVVERVGKERPAPAGKAGGPTKYDDWYLVRTKDKAGWGLTGNLDMSVPEEVLQYAEGKRVAAWFVLDPGPEVDGEKKPTILWATTANENGLDQDFEGIRIFSWGQRRKHYETSFIEGGLRGHYPITLERQPVQGGEDVTISFSSEDRQGKKVIRKYRVEKNRVRRLPVVPAA